MFFLNRFLLASETLSGLAGDRKDASVDVLQAQIGAHRQSDERLMYRASRSALEHHQGQVLRSKPRPPNGRAALHLCALPRDARRFPGLWEPRPAHHGHGLVSQLAQSELPTYKLEPNIQGGPRAPCRRGWEAAGRTPCLLRLLSNEIRPKSQTNDSGGPLEPLDSQKLRIDRA